MVWSVCTKQRTSKPADWSSSSAPVLRWPWEDISVDLITGLPMDEGFNSVCTVVDQFSKEVNIFPVASTLIAQELATEIKERIWRKHGLPKSILSNCGPQFISSFWQELLE